MSSSLEQRTHFLNRWLPLGISILHHCVNHFFSCLPIDPTLFHQTQYFCLVKLDLIFIHDFVIFFEFVLQTQKKMENMSQHLQIYKLMASILRKAAKYKRVSTVLQEGEAHLKDPFFTPPQILKPPAPRTPTPDDITDFPQYKTIPIPETVPYMEGKYRPPSIPFVTGWFPYNSYLQQGKVYNWCACGLSLNNPFCDGSCNAAITRCRPVQFNVSESGYYKLCNCKNSANAPFCNGTHRDLIKFYHKSHRGFYEIWGEVAFYAGFLYMYWNWYT